MRSQGVREGAIHLWEADASKLDWRRLGLVAEFHGIEDYTYPWMAHLGDDSWFVVFYAGQTAGPNAIYGMVIQIPARTGTI